MPKRPKQGPGPGAVSITGRRKARQSSIVPIPVQKKNGDALESYEQTVERPGPIRPEPEYPTRHLDGPIVQRQIED